MNVFEIESWFPPFRNAMKSEVHRLSLGIDPKESERTSWCPQWQSPLSFQKKIMNSSSHFHKRYNYPQGRVTDHRAGITKHRSEGVVAPYFPCTILVKKQCPFNAPLTNSQHRQNVGRCLSFRIGKIPRVPKNEGKMRNILQMLILNEWSHRLMAWYSGIKSND